MLGNGQSAPALEIFKASLAPVTSLVEDDPGNANFQARLAEVDATIAEAYAREERWGEAAEAYGWAVQRSVAAQANLRGRVGKLSRPVHAASCPMPLNGRGPAIGRPLPRPRCCARGATKPPAGNIPPPIGATCVRRPQRAWRP